MKRTQKPVIAITAGDFNGIGPEVALKCALMPSVRRLCSPLLVGLPEVFAFYASRLRIPVKLSIVEDTLFNLSDRTLAVFPASEGKYYNIKPGVLSTSSGRHAASAIRVACDLAMRKKVQAMVTGPVNKKALHQAGVAFDGQTEFLQHLTRSKSVTMMLVSDTMRVGLTTIHLPLKKVAQRLTRRLLSETIGSVHSALRTDWKIPRPKIAVLALNPHAGENGDIGHEERTIIAPAIRDAKRRRLSVDGPFPADSFFGRYRAGMFDAVIAMYHDQGLIPLKMTSFGSAVNVSAGLPIVRTSPDHGTAFDIAGKGMADPGSMIAAVKLAVTIANNRKKNAG